MQFLFSSGLFALFLALILSGCESTSQSNVPTPTAGRTSSSTATSHGEDQMTRKTKVESFGARQTGTHL